MTNKRFTGFIFEVWLILENWCSYTAITHSLFSCPLFQTFLSLQGNHDMARELYQSLLTQVASEHFYFWLNSLKEFSHAEQCLTGLQEDNYSSALSCIAEALKSYHKGIASLTVSTDLLL